MTTFEGAPTGGGRRLAIIAARFNEAVTSRLVQGALDALHHRGVADEDVDVAWVPGAFEIPLVAGETARGIGEVSRTSGVPVIFEVLATEDLAQAEARAGGAHGNKGWEAALAALAMASLLDDLPKETSP